MSEVAVIVMEIGAARRLSERIRLTAHSARENLARLQVLVQEARAGQAHVALGYASWTAYLADVFGEEPLRLPRDQRQELVGYLAGEGMSTRAIAPIVGISQSAVDRDVQVTRHGSPEPETFECDSCHAEFGMDRRNHTAIGLLCHECSQDFDVNTETGEVFESPEPPRPVTGLDGKTYTRLPASGPRRKPITESFWTAAYDLSKRIESVHRLLNDDRFPPNADEVAAAHRNDLIRYRDLLQEVIDRLPSA